MDKQQTFCDNFSHKNHAKSNEIVCILLDVLWTSLKHLADILWYKVDTIRIEKNDQDFVDDIFKYIS